MLDILHKLERWLIVVLVAMLAVVVVLSVVELGYTIGHTIVKPPILFPGIDDLLDIFGKFLLVLIGIELLETMRALAKEGVVRVEVVLTVAMIAMARKIIVLEPTSSSGLAMFGVAALLVSLSVAYQVYVRGRPREGGR
jgi:uncharacterized membrane protein (DUF373 family)